MIHKTMRHLVNFLAIGIGGFIGAIARYVVALLCGWILGTGFPWGTLIINLSGSFIIGWFLTAASQRLMVTEPIRLAVAVGFVGAYTTFSTYMYESSGLIQQGAAVKAFLNLVGSVVLGYIAVRLGIMFGSRV